MAKKNKKIPRIRSFTVLVILAVVVAFILPVVFALIGFTYAKINYQTSLVYGHVDPYIRFKNCNISVCTAPVGLASYGVYNNNNTKTYTIKTHGLAGEAYIRSIKAVNPRTSLPANSASLQLNGILMVKHRVGEDKYALQLVTSFYTDSNDINFIIEIYGINTELAQQSFIGGPNCWFTTPSSEYPYYDCSLYFANDNINLSSHTPLHLEMVMRTYVTENSVNIKPVVIYWTTDPKINNTLSTVNFSIVDKLARDSYFLVDGKNYSGIAVGPSNPNLNDAEFVFAGYGNGQIANFSKLNATLKLLYYNSSTNEFQYFPSYYNFGSLTAETANKLSTSLLHNNTVTVTPGNPNYGYIGNSTNSP